MDTLYLRIFHNSTNLDKLIDEQASLVSQLHDAQMDLGFAFAEEDYSEARRINRDIAALKTKKCYIDRMVYVVQGKAAKPVFISHPDNYYAEEL